MERRDLFLTLLFILLFNRLVMAETYRECEHLWCFIGRITAENFNSTNKTG